MPEEQEVYDKVRSTLVTDHVTEKRGGVAFGLTFISEEAPKMPPRRLMELKKEDSEKWRGMCKEMARLQLFYYLEWQNINITWFIILFFPTENQGKILARKQLVAQQNREDARIKKQIETAHKEMARLEKYFNVNAD